LQTLLNQIMIYLVALSLILCSAAFAFRKFAVIFEFCIYLKYCTPTN
jgi:hypothetical protein